MLSQRSVLVVVLAAGCLASFARGGEEPKNPAGGGEGGKPSAVASDEDIGRLIEQLDAQRFPDRQAASEKLAAIGKPAIAALQKAAAGESLEITIRAIELLRKFLDSPDELTANAARAALEALAKSDRPAVARRADEMLKTHQLQQRRRQVPPLNPGAQIIQGGIQIVANAGGMKRLSVRNVNGAREIDVTENDRKIKIRDDAQQGIKIEVTRQKDGKEVTDKYEAKNVEDLKKNQPEGYKVYKEYGENQGPAMFQVQIQANGVPWAPGQVPVPLPVPFPAAPANAVPAPAMMAGNQMSIASMYARRLVKQLSGIGKEQLQQAPQAAQDELKKQLDELKQEVAELEKRLQAKHEPAPAKPDPEGKR